MLLGKSTTQLSPHATCTGVLPNGRINVGKYVAVECVCWFQANNRSEAPIPYSKNRTLTIPWPRISGLFQMMGQGFSSGYMTPLGFDSGESYSKPGTKDGEPRTMLQDLKTRISRTYCWQGDGPNYSPSHLPGFSLTYPLKLPAPWGSSPLLHIAHVTQQVSKVVFLRGKY